MSKNNHQKVIIKKGLAPLKNSCKNICKKICGNFKCVSGSKYKTRNYLTGFTLIEILIVLAVISIIASIILIMITSSKERSKVARGLKFSDSVRARLSTYEIAWWKLDNNTNDVWRNNNGTLNGSATYSSGVGQGNSLNPGANGYVRVSPLLYKNNPVWTFAVWVKGSSNAGTVFSEGYSSSTIPFLTFRSSGAKLNLSTTDNLWNGNINLTSNADVFNGEWRHIVIIDNNGVVNIYIDGNRDTATQTYTRNGSGFNSLNIGTIGAFGRSGAPNGFFNGQIDEVQIWNSALTAMEIQQRYAESAPRYGIALK